MLTHGSDTAYASWHTQSRITLARIFDVREVVQNFDLISSHPLPFNQTANSDLATASKRLAAEIKFLEQLVSRLPNLAVVKKDVR